MTSKFRPFSSAPKDYQTLQPNLKENQSSKFRPLSKESSEEVSRLRSLLGAAPKGAAKTLKSAFMHEADPLSTILEQFGVSSPSTAQSEVLEKGIEKALPTQEKFAEDALERFGGYLPLLLGGGLGSIPRAAGAALAGQGVEEMGGGPVAQGLTELAFFGAPGFRKKIIPKNPQQKRLIDFARSQGLKENEIAKLIQPTEKIRKFTATAKKSPKRFGEIKEARGKAGEIYNKIKAHPTAEEPLAENLQSNFLKEARDIYYDLPRDVRQGVKKDLKRLFNSDFSSRDLIDFYQAVGKKARRGNNFVLNSFKRPISETLGQAHPDIAEPFKLTNELYKQGTELMKGYKGALKSTPFKRLYKAGKMGQLIYGLSTGNVIVLGELVGEGVAKRIADKMLTSPRFQNLRKQMLEAIKKNKIPESKKIADTIIEESKED